MASIKPLTSHIQMAETRQIARAPCIAAPPRIRDRKWMSKRQRWLSANPRSWPRPTARPYCHPPKGRAECESPRGRGPQEGGAQQEIRPHAAALWLGRGLGGIWGKTVSHLWRRKWAMEWTTACTD